MPSVVDAGSTPARAHKKETNMACEICGRWDCTRSFHSLAAQYEFDRRKGMGVDDEEELRDQLMVANEALRDRITKLEAKNERLRAACIKKNYAIEHTLGRALGYVEPDGTVNVCEHTAETLAMGAARELSVRERQAEILAGEGWSNGKTVEPFKSERLSKALAQARAEIAKDAEVKPEAKP
jgi:hypothetical protein